MTKTKPRIHAADFASTPTGAGQYSLVESKSQAPKTADFADPHSVKSTILCRQIAPRPSHRALHGIEAAFQAATPFSKSPYIAE
jgi:hypothetical protein